MATVTKDFRVKAGLVVEGSTATVNGKNIITAGVVDAKGDLIVGSADDAVARLGVGYKWSSTYSKLKCYIWC
jgi:hypothetical protein